MINFLNCLLKLERGNAKREAVLTCSTLFVVLSHTTFPVSSCEFVVAEFVDPLYTALNYLSNDYSIDNLAG